MKYFFRTVAFAALLFVPFSTVFSQDLKPTLTHDLVFGTVINEKEEGVKGIIEFYNPVTDKLVQKSPLDESGAFKLLLPKKSKYYFTIRSGYFTYFFKDDSHITETSTEAVPTELELSFMVLQYSKGTSIILNDLNFPSNGFELNASHKPALDFLADFLKKNPKINIQVAGHTDNVGIEADNKNLSQKRAETVRNYLVDTAKILDERITSYGYGQTRPLTTNETQEGRAINRRTSFIITQGVQ